MFFTNNANLKKKNFFFGWGWWQKVSGCVGGAPVSEIFLLWIQI